MKLLHRCLLAAPSTAAAAAPVLIALLPAAAAAQPQLKVYDTPYYYIHTDLDIEGAREAAVRMTAMAREYLRRTQGFAGQIRRKLPFYLYRNAADYHAAGGVPGSGGVFKGRKLMAVAGKDTGGYTWHVVQHEGFHQFAHYVIGGKIPVWVNEGLAEYFGEAVFTGDGFVVGVVPPGRLRRLKKLIQAEKIKTVRQMLRMSYKEWTGKLVLANYDAAWSMVHFLVHADDGRYVNALSNLLNDIALRRMRYEHAWVKNFGRDLDAFQKRYTDYWLRLPDDPTRRLYQRAVMETMTSFFARAVGRRMRFDDADQFFAAAEGGKLKPGMKDYLPPSLLEAALPEARRLGAWSIEKTGPNPHLVCELPDGRRFVGRFTFKEGVVAKVTVKLRAKRAASVRSRPRPTPAVSKPSPGSLPDVPRD